MRQDLKLIHGIDEINLPLLELESHLTLLFNATSPILNDVSIEHVHMVLHRSLLLIEEAKAGLDKVVEYQCEDKDQKRLQAVQ